MAKGDAGVDSPGGRRERTQSLFIATAMELARNGAAVTVADVAAAAGVSRATAYRYFPSRTRLIETIVEQSLGPVRRFESREIEGTARVRDLFVQTFPRFKEFEAQLRAALQLALEHAALDKAGVLAEEPFRRGHRRAILARAARPLRMQLGKRDFERMLKALSLVYGIEPYVILEDIWGSSNREVDRVARWVADAIMEKALRETATARRTTTK
ncbi:MAG: TetR family transcriptional regulator [Betaproteobacteria bacterium]